MAKRVGVDKWLFGVVLLLVLFGLIMVFSASAVVAKSETGSPYYYVVKQGGFALAGMFALVLLMKVDYRKYNNPKVVFPAMAITTLFLISVFAMHALNHTHRWFKLGPFTFQPSELAKPMVVLFLAWFLQTRIHKMDDWKGTVIKAALPPLVFVALILKEPDLGTALVCAGVTMLMLYLAGLQTKWIGIAILAASPVMYYMLFMVPWRRARMLAYTNPEADPLGKGFHIMQSLIAVGTGGFNGLGLMEGRQKLYFLPEAWTDFIFAHISEELGLLGALTLVAPLRDVRLPRSACGLPVDRSVCPLPGLRPHDRRPHPGLLQHLRRNRAAADQRHHAPVHFLRRHVALLHARGHGRAAQHHPGDRLVRWLFLRPAPPSISGQLLALAAWCILATAAPAFGQTRAQMSAYSTRAANATAVLHGEEVRQQAGICKDAAPASLNDCLTRELTATGSNYLEYVRSIGAMLRGVDPQVPPQPLPFDAAELAWQDYRDKFCDAIFKGSRGLGKGPPDNACRIKLTLYHMHELHDFYRDLF